MLRLTQRYAFLPFARVEQQRRIAYVFHIFAAYLPQFAACGTFPRRKRAEFHQRRSDAPQLIVGHGGRRRSIRDFPAVRPFQQVRVHVLPVDAFQLVGMLVDDLVAAAHGHVECVSQRIQLFRLLIASLAHMYVRADEPLEIAHALLAQSRNRQHG